MRSETLLQNENTMLVSAHKHAHLKCVCTYCRLIVFKIQSYLVCRVMVRHFWSFQLYYYYFWKHFMGTQKETPLLAVNASNHIYFCFSSSKANCCLEVVWSCCQTVRMWAALPIGFYLPTIKNISGQCLGEGVRGGVTFSWLSCLCLRIRMCLAESWLMLQKEKYHMLKI